MKTATSPEEEMSMYNNDIHKAMDREVNQHKLELGH
jgi:hypothetical protein